MAPLPPAIPALLLPLLRPAEHQSAELTNFINGWWVVLITVLTALPWAIVAVWDAIDAEYRPRSEVALRLAVSSVCLVLAYTAGLLFLTTLTLEILAGREDDRHDEVATVLVLLVFNLWHVLRNVVGWSQYIAIHKLRLTFVLVQTHFAQSFHLACSRYHAPPPPAHPSPPDTLPDTHAEQLQWPRQKPRKPCIQQLVRLRISERLFDNEWRRDMPFLSPFFRISTGNARHRFDDAEREAWAVATWRAWWTQDTHVMGLIPELRSPDYRVAQTDRHPVVEDLLSTTPPNVTSGPVFDSQGRQVNTAREWADALAVYGGEEGQQDTHGEPLPQAICLSDATGLALLIHEKVTRVPNRMSALWYSTARFEEMYAEKARELGSYTPTQPSTNATTGCVLFPSWPGWLRLAQDIGTHLPRPVYLSDTHLVNFAGELAAASIILVKYPEKYAALVQQIWLDGRNARWTFGWSGLLACFSHLWTIERVYIAMLNGLSLMALSTKTHVKDIDENVRSMLYGYAAFEVSDRAVGKTIANDRKAELLKRYSQDRGKTCRGSGLCATRLACRVLGIPAEASHMDGLPAFSTGWCSEYMERLPGNQKPAYGDSHDEVEALEGSSNVWRYPHSHT